MDDNQVQIVAVIPKREGAGKVIGKQNVCQKRRRSVTPMRPVAIAPKTDSPKNMKNFELNQSIIIKSEPGFVTIAPKTNQFPNFDQYCITENNSESSSNNPESAKRMKLAPKNVTTTQYIIVQNQNLDSPNGVFVADNEERIIIRPKNKMQEYTIVQKYPQNVNNTLQQYNIVDKSNLGDYSNFSIVPKLNSSNTDEISIGPNPEKFNSHLNANRAIPISGSSSPSSIATNCGLNSLKNPTSDMNPSLKTLSSQKPKSQKPVVIMQQLLSPAQKMNSLKSKQILLQGLNKLVPLNIHNIKVEPKPTPGRTSPSELNETFNHDSKIIHCDVTKGSFEPKNEFISKTEEFPAISSSQVDSVLKAIDMQGQNKEIISNEAGDHEKKNREDDSIGTKIMHSLPSSQGAAKLSKIESIPQYSDLVVNAPARLHIKNEPNRPVKRIQNQKLKCPTAKQLEMYVDTLQCYKCKECPYISLNDKQIVEHIEKEHSNIVEKEEKPVLKCPGCTNTFHYNASLLSHIVHDHQVHESEAQVMMQKLCHREHATDRSGDQKPPSEIQITEQQTEKFETGQVSDGSVQNDQCMENISISHPHGLLTMDTTNASFQTLENNTILESNGVQSFQNMTTMPVTIANNLETLNLQNVQFLDDMKILPMKNDGQNQSIKVLELKNGERNFEFVNFKNETHNEDESYLQEDDAMDPAISSGETEFVNIRESKLDEENKELDAKKVKPKKKGRPKGSKTNITKQSTADLKQLGYKCEAEECGIRMLAKENILYHQKCHVHSTDDSNTSYQCPECLEFKSNNWNNLAGHLWRSHIIDMELHACDLCSYKTPSLSNLMNQHRGIHGDDRPFLCDNCGKGFKTTKQLRNHRALHRAKDKEPLECSECRRVFSNMRLLKLHKDSVHKESKPFMCNFCTYSASTRSALKLHLRRHTGEKPFSCEQCAYSTGDHNSLRRHKLRHLGLKPYSCPHCSYACIQSSTYKVHLKNKHPGLDHGLMFSCQYCSYRSIKKENLLTHMAKHEQGSSKASAFSDSSIFVE